MADEIDAGQERGEVPVQGQHATHVQGADMTELGIPRQRVSEWRAARDKGEEAVKEAIQSALGKGRAPTKDRQRQPRINPLIVPSTSPHAK